jgi:hypothetical protein
MTCTRTAVQAAAEAAGPAAPLQLLLLACQHQLPTASLECAAVHTPEFISITTSARQET